ncbi:hypothetical protein BDV11DRAFT_215989 [Aspergillus similis]
MTKPPLPQTPLALSQYTNTGLDQAAQGPLFVAQRFSHSQATTIGPHLRASLRLCASQNRALIIPSESWLLDTLCSEFNGIPRDLHGRTEQNVLTMDFEDGTITVQGVAALILSASRLDRNIEGNKPAIILWLASLGLLPRLDRYLGGPDNSWRMKRLLHCPLWIYMDLFQACGDWAGVWDVARRDVARRDAQAYEDSLRPSALHLTHKLHKAASNVITLREDLRLHIASFECNRDHISQRTMGPWPSESPFKETLAERAAELQDDLDYHRETSAVISSQYSSLLGLVFNTETVAQGQAVARLNILHSCLCPLILTFSVSAVWYPLWAAVALVAVVTAAYLVGKLSGENSTGPYSFLRQHFANRLHRHPPSDHNLSSRLAINRPDQRARRITERQERLRRNATGPPDIQRARSPAEVEWLNIPHPVRGPKSEGRFNHRADVVQDSEEEDAEHTDEGPAMTQVEPHSHRRDLFSDDLSKDDLRTHSKKTKRVQRGVTLLHRPLDNRQD